MVDLRGHTRMPNVLATYQGLSGNCLKTLFVLMSYAYGSKATCWPSQELLASVTGFSRTTVNLHIARLAKMNLIKKRRGGNGEPCQYVITLKEASPHLRKSVVAALTTLHPMLRRKTRAKEWDTLIRHDRELRRVGRA